MPKQINRELFRWLQKKEAIQLILYFLRWISLSALIGSLAGSASAFFLISLDEVTLFRESHTWIIILLPLAGLVIGMAYHYFGKNVEGGNNLLLDKIHDPKKEIDFIMAPLIFITTLLTHLFGGSAGREGTAVQMGGSLADQLNRIVKFRARDKRIIIICGISAGFASVFGTPLAGMVFGLEVLFIGRLNYKAIFPSMLSAIIANLVCDAWGVHHTSYLIQAIPEISTLNILYCMFAGIIFGITAWIFSRLTKGIRAVFKKYVAYPPLRPAIGGVFVAGAVFALATTKYIGLGIPTIVDAFNNHLPPYDFALKTLFTVMTLGAGFKGGEVTPLFFIGATLGNALSYLIPLPIGLLAGLGFVAVFAGAANTPLTSILVAIEIFGIECGVYASIACIMAYMFSGHAGIYSSQGIGENKHRFSVKKKNKKNSGTDDSMPMKKKKE